LIHPDIHLNHRLVLLPSYTMQFNFVFLHLRYQQILF
jgi:hypothetical protein